MPLSTVQADDLRLIAANGSPDNYVAGDQRPTTPDPSSTAFRVLVRHRGSVRGAWPTVSLHRRT